MRIAGKKRFDTVTILSAFGNVTVFSASHGDAGDLEDYRGLFSRRPVINGILAAALFSLAGIPATIGLPGKFYILAPEQIRQPGC